MGYYTKHGHCEPIESGSTARQSTKRWSKSVQQRFGEFEYDYQPATTRSCWVRARTFAVKYKGRVLFSMHPTVNVAGRLWIICQVHQTSRSSSTREFPKLDEYGYPDKQFPHLKYPHDYNRTITVIKKRRAGGWMPVIGANMDSKTLWTFERGWL